MIMTIPFPQANNLGKILMLVTLFQTRTKEEIKTALKISTKRQYYYYCYASVFLGFMKIESKRFHLSNEGKIISGEKKDYQKERFILYLLKNVLIRKILFNLDENTNLNKILDEQFDSFRELSEATKKRRISTIKSWIRWINKNL